MLADLLAGKGNINEGTLSTGKQTKSHYISVRPNQIAVLVGTSGSEIGVDMAARR